MRFIFIFFISISGFASKDPLPSWNEGAAKSAILSFIKQTCDPKSPNYVPEDSRFVAFDQDGTICVEKPLYVQFIYLMDELREGASPFFPRSISSLIDRGNEEINNISFSNLETLHSLPPIIKSVKNSREKIRQWLITARDPRWKKKYTQLFYQPMKEVIQLFRLNGYKIYIATGGGQEFTRVYCEDLIEGRTECVSGQAFGTYLNDEGILVQSDFPLLNAHTPKGKARALYFMLGQVPTAAFGNADEDKYMLEYTWSGQGARLAMLVLHDDAEREYAYGPAEHLPDSIVGKFSQDLYDEAKSKGWTVISMKNDWKRIFSFDDR